jgi:hypothetical protein
MKLMVRSSATANARSILSSVGSTAMQIDLSFASPTFGVRPLLIAECSIPLSDMKCIAERYCARLFYSQ